MDPDNIESLEYTVIEVPDMNDSMSRIALDKKQYTIRFTYNMYEDCWTFGLYNSLEQPIAIGLKIVPNIALNLYVTHLNMPDGAFAAITRLPRIGRYAFKEGQATFVYISLSQLE